MRPIDGGERWYTVVDGAGERGYEGGLAAAGRAHGRDPGRGRRQHAETVRVPGSWLEAEVRRLLPGRRVDVYVTPTASGVFALGGHTIGLGKASLGAGVPTPALLSATAAAVDELRRGPPARAAADLVGRAVVGRQADPPTPSAAPVAAADQGVGVLLLLASIVSSVHGGSPSAVVLTVGGVPDLSTTGIRSRRQHVEDSGVFDSGGVAGSPSASW